MFAASSTFNTKSHILNFYWNLFTRSVICTLNWFHLFSRDSIVHVFWCSSPAILRKELNLEMKKIYCQYCLVLFVCANHYMLTTNLDCVLKYLVSADSFSRLASSLGRPAMYFKFTAALRSISLAMQYRALHCTAKFVNQICKNLIKI